jgi:hypothetical protein
MTGRMDAAKCVLIVDYRLTIRCDTILLGIMEEENGTYIQGQLVTSLRSFVACMFK